MKNKTQIGQIWKSNSSPWTIRILDIYTGSEWVDSDFIVISFETIDGFVGEKTGGKIYEHHLMQMFHLMENDNG